jgi:hypothetical protein
MTTRINEAWHALEGSIEICFELIETGNSYDGWTSKPTGKFSMWINGRRLPDHYNAFGLRDAVRAELETNPLDPFDVMSNAAEAAGLRAIEEMYG